MLLSPTILAGQSVLINRYFSSPTGKSAVEDYVRAAEVVARPEFEAYRAWEISVARSLETPTIRPSLPHVMAPQGIDQTEFRRQEGLRMRALEAELRRQNGRWKEYLSFCSDEVANFGGALGLIRIGNAKSLSSAPDVRDLDPYFESLTNLGIRAAYLKLAQSKPGEAATYLLDQVTFLDNVERCESSGTPALIGESAVLTMFAHSLESFGLADCESISRVASAMLARPAALQSAYSLRKDAWTRSIQVYAESAADPSAPVAAVGEDPTGRAIALRLRSMTPQARVQAINEAQSIAIRTASAASQSLNRPEREWISPRTADPVPPTSDEQLPTALARVTQSLNPSSARVDAVLRTRIRILALSAKTRAFWLRNARYPKGLAELGQGVDADPLSGKTFVYRRVGIRFEISSEGTPETGPVFLDASVKRDDRGNALPG